MLFLGMTNVIGIIRTFTPKSTIRGLQLALGMVLLTKGLGLIVAEDPNLAVQTVGPINTGILLGTAGIWGGAIEPLYSPQLLVQALLVAVAAGIAGGLYPAWRATRMRPVEALRYE